jgi:hypothetical protein
MKTIVLVFILIPLICNSQSINIESFNGIKFGTSRQEALKAATGLGASLVSLNEFEELACMSNFTFAGVSSKAAYLKFVDDKLYEGIMEFEIDPNNYNALYNKMKNVLTTSYGYGKDFSWMDSPFYFGDGQELRALVQGKGKLCHVWAKGKQVTADDFIVMEIGADKILRLVFQNHAYASMATKKIRHLEASNK